MAGKDPEHDKLVAPADWNGPIERRHCTDILCLLMLLVSWIFMTAIGAYAAMQGDYRLVVYPLDYDGNICGTDFAEDMTDFPYLYYINSYTGGVCVEECPKLQGQTADNLTDVRTMVTYAGMWQTQGSELPIDFVKVGGNYSQSPDAIACTEDTCFPNNSTVESWTSEGISEGFGYAYYVADTYELLWRCYLTTAAEERLTNLTESDGGLDAVDTAYRFWEQLYGDLYISRWYVIGFGFGVSLAVSFTYIFLMRLPVLLDALIWSSIAITIGLFVMAGYYAWNLASEWDAEEPQVQNDQTIYLTTLAAVILWIVAALLILLTICMRKRIQVAVGCVKQAGRAINQMTLILLVPVLQAIGFLLFFTMFLFYGINLASMGEITTNDVTLDPVTGKEIAYRTYSFDDFTYNCGWYLLFCLFWTANFVVAVGDMTVALAVSKWYFTKPKYKIGSWTVLTSLGQTLYYHTGTCAYGSLILAVVQIIRALIARAQRAAKNTNNKIASCLLCCCQCCFCVLECCLKFLNKNAYIQTAIFGTAFCKSCRNAFFLILRNAARIAAVSYVSAAVLIVGKLFISTLVTSFAYYAITSNLQDELYSVAGPVVVIFLLSYWMSDFFMDVFDMAVSTVLQCFVADEEMYSDGGGYADKPLTDWVDKHADKSSSDS